MQNTEFERELDIFRHEVEAATQLFYAYTAIQAAMADHEKVEDLLNEAALFWKTCLYGLQASTFIALGRVFDQDRKSKHNLDRLIGIGQSNPGIFSKAALGRRKQGDSPRRPEWLDDYLSKAYEPEPEDFRRLRRHIAKWRRVYEANYRPIRHAMFAHRSVFDDEQSRTLWVKTKLSEMQLLLRFLRQFYDALWELFHNGKKPVLRPQRYSTKSIRDRPSESGRINDLPERITFEAESFLLKSSGLPPPKKPRRNSGDTFDIFNS